MKFRKIRGESSSATTKKRKILIYAAVAIVIAISFVLVIGNVTNNAKNRTTDLSVTELNKLVSQSHKESKQKFVTQFCGLNSTPNSNEYIVEYTLPSVCEMPLGIAIDNNTGRVWYISTKNGSLGSFDIKTGKFGAESKIPTWEARDNPTASSQVWDVKLDDKDNLWFTDERQNAIWRYSNISSVDNNSNNNNSSSKSLFYMYRIPGNSKAFGTIYPVSIELDGKGKIYFVGVRSPSIWIGNISEMKNGTSNGIEQIKIPTEGFKGIDPDLISTGSIALDKKNNTLWISLLAFNAKGQIVRYNIGNETFRIYDMPQDIRSPVGLALDRTGNLWVTDHATNIFYKLDPQLGSITKFVTSRISPRIFGMDAGADVSRQISEAASSSSGTTNSTSFENAYTLPYWIKTDSNGSLWFNEHEGNKIAMFDPKTSTLVEYWIPTQNRLWGICHNDSNNTNFNNGNRNQCGIANVLQFDVGIDRDIQRHPQVWFSEWSENKIGRILTNKSLPFSVSVSPAELTIRRGSISEVKVNLISNFENSSSLNMLSSGSFTPYGALLNASGTFSQQTIDLQSRGTKQISYIFTANPDLRPGNYTLMLGADSGPISILKAVYIKVI